MIPRIPLTDKRFVYRDSASTDIRKTFDEARKRIAAEKLRTVCTRIDQRKRA